MERQYKAFISYSHADERSAAWLHRALETYKIPADIAEARDLDSRHLRPIFRDREEMASSTDLGGEIRKALDESETLVVICSPATKKSRWVNEEIQYFAKLGRASRIFTLITSGEPGSTDEDCMPEALSLISDSEHLAADIRPGKDGRQLARLKLIAGMLNIRLDDLRQRESRRRQERLTAISLASTAGMIVALALMWFAFDSRDHAETARSESETVVQFLADMLSAANPGIVDKDVTVRTVLDNAAQSIDEDLAQQPLVEARLRGTIADTYQALGLYAEAEAHQLRRVAILEAFNNLDDPGRLDAMSALSWLKREQGLYEESVALAEEAYEFRLQSLGPNDAETLKAHISLANSYEEIGRFDEAEEILTNVLEFRRETLGEDHKDTATSLEQYGRFLWQAGDLQNAREYLAQAFEIDKRTLGEEHPDTLIAMGNLTAVISQLGNKAEATASRRKMLEIQRRKLGENHPSTLITMTNLAVTLADQQQYDESVELLNAAIAAHTRIDGDQHPRTLYAMHNLATIYTSQGDLASAEGMHRNSLAAMREVLGRDNVWTMNAIGSLANILCRQEKYDEAEALFSEFVDNAPNAFPSGHPQIYIFRMSHTSCLVEQKLFARAEQLLQVMLTEIEQSQGFNSYQSRFVIQRLVDLYEAWGRTDTANQHRVMISVRQSAAEAAAGQESSVETEPD